MACRHEWGLVRFDGTDGGWNLFYGDEGEPTSEMYRSREEEARDVEMNGGCEEETVAFSKWINSTLSADPDLAHLIPVSPEGGDLYRKIDDGVIICKLINLAVPGTVDERAINKRNMNTYRKMDNRQLALMSAQSIGCTVVEIDNDDLSWSSPLLMTDLLWQIIRIGLFRTIDVDHEPAIYCLRRNGEKLEDLRRLSPEKILLRWVNYHLEHSEIPRSRRLVHFPKDMMDSAIYSHLLPQIAPREMDVNTTPMIFQGNHRRAVELRKEAAKMACDNFVSPSDVATGNYKLNLAFVANLFNKHPNLPAPRAGLVHVVEETREEKTYRNWMNSMGVDPYVTRLYSDLRNGKILLQLIHLIRPGIVNWKRVAKACNEMDAIQNCNYVVELAKQLRLHFVVLDESEPMRPRGPAPREPDPFPGVFPGVGTRIVHSSDLYKGDPDMLNALLWQLMRAHTLTILTQCTQSGDSLLADMDIIQWVNQK